MEKLRRWLQDPTLAIVIAMMLALPLLQANSPLLPTAPQNFALQLLGVALLWAVMGQQTWDQDAAPRLRRFLSRGVNLPALLFFTWALISALWTAPAGAGRVFALNDLLRLGVGVLVCLVVANQVRSRASIAILVNLLLLVAVVTVLERILFVRIPSGDPVVLPTRLLAARLFAGGLLCLLLPVLTAAAVAPLYPRLQLLAQIALALTAVTLLVTPVRSAWIAAMTGLVLLGVLAARCREVPASPPPPRRRPVVSPVAVGAGVLALALTLPVSHQRVAARVQTLPAVVRGQDGTFQERLVRWERTLGAIARRPAFGLGLGNYVLQQHAFTGYGRPERLVAQSGETMREQAHNEYVQLTAELGVPGLLLYLLLLGCFFARTGRALRSVSPPAERMLLIGCMAAIAAQSVDAISNPAWRYSVCAFYFWVVMGLGIALSRRAETLAEGR